MWISLLLACSNDPKGGGPNPFVDPPDDTVPTETTPDTGPPPCAELPVVEGDPALQRRAPVRSRPAACTTALHASAGAAGSELGVRIRADRPVLVTVTDPGGRTLVPETLVDGDAELAAVPEISGEVLIAVWQRDAREGEVFRFDLDVICRDGCDRPFSRYPILLMHGLSGADTIFGQDYFYRVTDTLLAEHLEVASPGVAAFDDSDARAFEWSTYIDELLARGHRRVNLWGHSQGGIDARALASPAGLDRGDVIASVTTLGTPHRGTPIADIVLRLFDGGVVDPAAFDVAVALFAAILGLQSDDPAFEAAMRQLAESTMEPLDVALVDHPDTWYGSWVGQSCGILEPSCINDLDGEIVDVLMSASYLLIWPRRNDGLVPADSQTHGVELGVVPADHADEIGQIADQSPDPFDHLGFYRSEVDRLEALGF